MLKDSTFFLSPQGNNKAPTEQKLCKYKYSGTDNQDFCTWWMLKHDAAIQLNSAPSRQEVKHRNNNIRLLFKIKHPLLTWHTNLKTETNTSSSADPSVGNTSCFYNTDL